jgi:uncharacterized protein YyaL (SSP411 family)
MNISAETNAKAANDLRRYVDPVSRLILVLLCLGVLLPRAMMAEETSRAQIDWQPWSDEVFVQAAKEHRFVLLDLGAVWCHWCHVMEDVTYRDPKVIALIGQRYIAVRVDQDARPDLSTRYENYGWPATVVFNSDGSEIVKRQGYIPPKPMASMLQAIIDDPSPGPSIVAEAPLEQAGDAGLTPGQRDKLRKILGDAYDSKNRGWGTVQKFLDWDIIEFCAGEALRGDQELERKARETLDAQRQLIDPVWGGVYQYSTDGDWKHPHFEKIMQMQAENLRSYAQAYALWKDPAHLEAAKKIRGYLHNFLTNPDGAFYTSQDADLVQGKHSASYFALSDADRRKRGIPRVDQHIYARENGWAINALATLYGVTGDESALADATRAAEWIIANRSLPGGGFRHDAQDPGGPYLGDSIYMARAFLKLYAVTAERKWLKRAEETAQFVEAKFKSDVGYVAFVQPLAGTLKPKPQVDENAAVVRTLNLLHRYTGRDIYEKAAQHAMRYLAAPAIGENHGYAVAGILLADNELAAQPLHVTVVGQKDDLAARSLFMAAIALPGNYKRVEWCDEREGPMPNPDVQYPTFEKAAGFLCVNRRCSAPIFDPAKIATFALKK